MLVPWAFASPWSASPWSCWWSPPQAARPSAAIVRMEKRNFFMFEFIVAKVEAQDLVSTSLVALLDNVEMPTETMVAEEKKIEPIAPVVPIVDEVKVVQAQAAEVDAETTVVEIEVEKESIVALVEEQSQWKYFLHFV